MHFVFVTDYIQVYNYISMRASEILITNIYEKIIQILYKSP